MNDPGGSSRSIEANQGVRAGQATVPGLNLRAGVYEESALGSPLVMCCSKVAQRGTPGCNTGCKHAVILSWVPVPPPPLYYALPASLPWAISA